MSAAVLSQLDPKTLFRGVWRNITSEHLYLPQKTQMEVPACELRCQTGNAKYSTYLEQVVHILVTAIVWPCWLDLLCLHHAINLHVYMFNWSGHQFSLWPGCQRSRNTGYMATFLFYLLEKLSKWKQKTSLIEEMVALSLQLGDCEPISFVYI